jgi:paraquat-inducible protein B
VPIVALLVGGWMVFRQFRDRGPEIVIEFADGSGIEAGKTQLVYKGVSVGMVREVELKENLSGVTVLVQLRKNSAALAREGTQFWIVQPEIGLSGVRGLDTLLTGPRINVRPGNGPAAEKFQGLDRSPPLENASEGRAFLLQGDRLGSLRPGAPVFYREVKVGVVETSRLANDSASVLVRIRIQTPYVDLVRMNTHFWNAGGASIKVSLLGAEVKSTSLESLFIGGVAFSTPDALSPVAPDGATFKIHNEADKDWLKWEARIPIDPPNEAPENVAPSGPLAPLVNP